MKRQHLISSLLILATFAVFYQVLTFGFVSWDDSINVYQNPYLNPVTSSSVLHFWQHIYFTVYTPLLYTAWAAVALVARLPAPVAPPGTGPYTLDPHVFHSINLLLHSVNVLLVFTLLRCLVRDVRAAGVGALLFAIHPVQVEPVAWVTGMATLLSGCLAFLSLWFYLRYAGVGVFDVQEQSTPNPDEQSAGNAGDAGKETPDGAIKRRRAHYVLATLCFGLALLIKPSTVVLPLIIWILDRWMLGRSPRASARALLPWGVMVVACIAATQWDQAAPAQGIATSLWERPRLVGDALAFYLGKLVLPLNLTVDYGRTPRYVLEHSWSYLTALVPLGLGILLWRQRVSRPWLLAAGAILMVGVLPTSGITPYYFHAYSTVADRYLYLAMLGPALGISFLLNRFPRTMPTAMCVLWLLGLGLLAARQTPYWRDTSTLFQHTLEINPNSWAAHNHLGLVLARQGKIEQAVEHYRSALRFKTDYATTYDNLGAALLQQNKTAEAITLWESALKALPDSPDLHYNLAGALERQGRIDDAMLHYREALRLRPDYVSAYNNLGAALLRRHRTAEAITLWNQALQFAPYSAELHYNLGSALDSGGETADAIRHYQEAVSINPNLTNARYNLGVDLLKSGRSREAIDQLSQVVQLQPESLEAHYNLGIALAREGQIEAAIGEWSTALRLNPGFVPAKEALAKAHNLQKSQALKP